MGIISRYYLRTYKERMKKLGLKTIKKYNMNILSRLIEHINMVNENIKEGTKVKFFSINELDMLYNEIAERRKLYSVYKIPPQIVSPMEDVLNSSEEYIVKMTRGSSFISTEISSIFFRIKDNSWTWATWMVKELIYLSPTDYPNISDSYITNENATFTYSSDYYINSSYEKISFKI